MRVAAVIGAVFGLICLVLPSAGVTGNAGAAAVVYLIGVLSLVETAVASICTLVIEGHITLSARRRASIATSVKVGGKGDAIVRMQPEANPHSQLG